MGIPAGSSGRGVSPALVLTLSLAGLAVLPGCGAKPGGGLPDPSQPIILDGIAKKPNPGANALKQARLSLAWDVERQRQNGPGLMIADPDPGTAAALRHFGRGCARWLRLAVGSQGELSKTPLWMTPERVLLELEQRRARVDLKEAARFATTAGVSHAALGRISGNPARCTLSLQVYKVPESQPVGAPVQVAGSLKEVTAALPDVARQLCARLGVDRPVVPEKPDETPDELTFLGSLPRAYNEHFHEAQEQRLSQIADRSMLAALIDVDHSTTRNAVATLNRRAEQLAVRAPENPLVWAVIAQSYDYLTRETKRPGEAKKVQAVLDRFPQNFNANIAQVYIRRPEGNYAEITKRAMEAVSCAAENPDGWAMLAAMRSAQAQEIRQGRTIDRLTGEELDVLPLLYSRELTAVQRQAALDPEYPEVWYSLAAAATTGGDEQLAEQAIWKALDAPYPSANSFWWAFEMFDPKWFGDAGRRQRVAKRAVAARYRTSQDRINVAGLLQAQGFAAQAKALLKSKEEQAVLAQTPQHVHSPNVRFTDAPQASPRASTIPPVVKEHPAYVQALYEHPEGARCVAWSPDGSALASGGRDRTVRIWRWPSGEPLVLTGHGRLVNAVAWNADGSQLASGSLDGTVRIWDARTGKPLKTLSGSGRPVMALAWSPDGKTLASGGEDRLIRLWNGATGAPAGVLRGHQGRIRHLSYRPDGRYLASAADEMSTERLWFWSTDSAHTVKRFNAQLSQHYSMAWTPDGKQFAAIGNSGNQNEALILINPEVSEQPAAEKNPYLQNTLWFAWSSDARKLLLVNGSRAFNLQNAVAGDGPRGEELRDHTKRTQAFAWNPKHQRLATAGADGQVLLWDLTKTVLKEMH